MIVDGRTIAEEIYAEVILETKNFVVAPRMTAITCAPNFETQKYLTLKKRKAAAAGIDLSVVEFPETATTEEIVACIEAVSTETDGIVVQLPLPAQVDREAVLAAVPNEKDPDGFSFGINDGACLPPVAGAIKEIAARYDLMWENKKIVVIGEGRLVGKPAVIFAQTVSSDVTVLNEFSKDTAEVLRAADVIISGAGQPQFITPEMIKEGVAIFDAGTSEDGGVLVGDVDPAVADKASIFTPVPGGIGPVTVAVLLRNLVSLKRQ